MEQEKKEVITSELNATNKSSNTKSPQNLDIEKKSDPEKSYKTGKDYQKVRKPKEKLTQEDILPILKLVAPGTALRSAISDIVRAKTGALIVVDAPGLTKMVEGGFRVNCRFTPQRLVELSKMDGALILSSDMNKILHANVLLAPDIKIPTRETGTRHKAAERTAKQIKTMTIAVSERRNTVTLYYETLRYTLKNSDEVLSRAVESLQLLEKQCEIFNDLLVNLNVLEFTNLQTMNDICLIIERAEIILKIASIIRRYIIELGTEGVLLRIRLKELIKDIEKEELLIINDYSKLKSKKTKNLFSVLSFEELLDIQNIIMALGCREEDIPSNKGMRILNKASIEQADIARLVEEFRNLNAILEAPTEKLIAVLRSESKARELQKDLIKMKEQVMLGKKI
jgi:diadenylate cyclase